MTNHHIQGPKCPLCDEKLKGGHPAIGIWFNAIKKLFPEVHTSWIFRGEQDQLLAYRLGRSRILFPHSQHNKTLDGEPYSRAMDLFILNPDGVMASDKVSIAKLGEVASYLIIQKAPIVWGGSWEKFKDYPHFQLKPEVSQNK